MGKALQGLFCFVLMGGLLSTPALTFAEGEKEITDLLGRLLGSPELQAQPGFSVSMLVPPGEFYDPLWILPQNAVVWINDDGGEKVKKAARF